MSHSAPASRPQQSQAATRGLIEPGTTLTVQIGDITVGRRHRRDLGDIASLAQIIADIEAVHLAACDKLIWLEGRVYATAHFFFGDGDERPVAEIRDGALWFFDKAAERRRDERFAALRSDGSPIETERQMERRIVAGIRASGRSCRQQVRCERGCVDIVIDGDDPAIVEVKAWLGWREIATAIGQLLLYGLSFPDHKLFLALPFALDADTVSAMRKAGVELWK